MVLFRKKKESSASARIVQLSIIKGSEETGDRKGKIFELQCGDNLIGRDSVCDIVLNSGTVSRRHANIKLSYDLSKFVIYDLGSANGVIIKPNTLLRNEKKPLNPGDEIQIGEILFKLVVSDLDEALQTMAVDVKALMKESVKK